MDALMKAIISRDPRVYNVEQHGDDIRVETTTERLDVAKRQVLGILQAVDSQEVPYSTVSIHMRIPNGNTLDPFTYSRRVIEGRRYVDDLEKIYLYVIQNEDPSTGEIMLEPKE